MFNIVYLSQSLLLRLKGFAPFFCVASATYFLLGGSRNYSMGFARENMFWIMSAPTLTMVVILFSINRIKDFDFYNIRSDSKAAIFYAGMIGLLFVFLYKFVLSNMLGIAVWDFSPELSGFSYKVTAIAQMNFRANHSYSHLIALYGFAITWGAVFFVGNEYFKNVLRRR